MRAYGRHNDGPEYPQSKSGIHEGGRHGQYSGAQRGFQQVGQSVAIPKIASFNHNFFWTQFLAHSRDRMLQISRLERIEVWAHHGADFRVSASSAFRHFVPINYLTTIRAITRSMGARRRLDKWGCSSCENCVITGYGKR